MSELNEIIKNCPQEETELNWVYRCMQNEVARLQSELDDMHRSFDLQWKAGQRAIKMWQKETGKDMMWPDKADLCVWLMNKIDELEIGKAFADAVKDYIVIHESGTVELHMMNIRNDSCVRMEGEQAVKYIGKADQGAEYDSAFAEMVAFGSTTISVGLDGLKRMVGVHQWPKYYRHIKTGGIYEFITTAQNENNLTTLVIYKSVTNGATWARPHKEFFDGRFEDCTEEHLAELNSEK